MPDHSDSPSAMRPGGSGRGEFRTLIVSNRPQALKVLG